MRTRFVVGAGLAVLCVSVAAPPLALAGSVTYFGPIAQPGNTGQPAVKLQVRTKKKKPFELRSFAAYEPTTPPCDGSLGGLTFSQVKFPVDLVPVPITKRSFSAIVVDDAGDSLEINGVIPKKGPATGTLHLIEHFTAGGGPCDTGVLSWEAALYDKPYD